MLFPVSLVFPILKNCIGEVMVGMLTSIVTDCGFEPRSDQTKDYEIGISCFSAKQAALNRKKKDWLVGGIKIMCLSGLTYLSENYWSSTKRTSSNYHTIVATKAPC